MAKKPAYGPNRPTGTGGVKPSKPTSYSKPMKPKPVKPGKPTLKPTKPMKPTGSMKPRPSKPGQAVGTAKRTPLRMDPIPNRGATKPQIVNEPDRYMSPSLIRDMERMTKGPVS